MYTPSAIARVNLGQSVAQTVTSSSGSSNMVRHCRAGEISDVRTLDFPCVRTRCACAARLWLRIGSVCISQILPNMAQPRASCAMWVWRVVFRDILPCSPVNTDVIQERVAPCSTFEA